MMENSKKEINQMVDSVTAGPLCAFMQIEWIPSEHMAESLGSRQRARVQLLLTPFLVRHLCVRYNPHKHTWQPAQPSMSLFLE